jgi:glutamate dehydrogenase
LKILLVHGESSQDRRRSRERAESMLALIDGEAEEPRRKLLRALTGLLFPPESTLAALPVATAFELTKEAFDLMNQRQEDIALRQWTPNGEKHVFLLVNLPETPYAPSALQILPSVRDGTLELASYLPVSVERGAQGIVGLNAPKRGVRESLIILKFKAGEVARLDVLSGLTAALQTSRDTERLQGRLDDLMAMPALKPWRELLDWLRTGAFQTFAYRRWTASAKGRHWRCGADRLGIALPGEPAGKVGLEDLFGAARAEALLRRESPLVVRQTLVPSPLCRSEPLSYIGCRHVLPDGSLEEHGFLGLFSSRALRDPAFSVPALREKIVRALESLSVAAGSYDFQRAADLFNAFPKVELFFTGDEQLHLITRSLLHFLTRPGKLKLLLLASASPDVFVLLGLQPKEWFREKNASELQSWLSRQLAATLESTHIIRGGTNYVGLCWTLVPLTDEVHLDLEELEKGLNRVVQFWEHRFRNLLERFAGKPAGTTIATRYHQVFPPGYREWTPPGLAVRDALHLERVIDSGLDALELWTPSRDPAGPRHLLRLYSLRERFLDELLPLLENLGLRVADEVEFTIHLEERKLFIKSFSVRPASAQALPLMTLKDTLLEALQALLAHRVENDGLNGLLPLTGLSWLEIDVFRGYRNYYLQLGTHFTRQRFHQALLHNPQITLLQYRYFEARFNPAGMETARRGREEEVLSGLQLELAAALDAVSDLSEDRILRDLFNLIDATMRTSYFLRRGRDDYFFAFKISSLGVFNMPAPRPLFEIYVHAATMEGIHLRGGKVARGGIRWSDRPDDFRSEILDLMQTQMIKNAQIVPHGAKGGFILKTPFRGRDEGAQLSKQAYSTLIRGLLDLTDNIGDSGIVRPASVVAYDDEDPYLVVAADKGTAHLSDTANALSREYGFWLADAFASGGSHGYDHKKLGITARGAWECVKRHFRELGRDLETQPVTVVGIGSMDGDVFGNGMLMSTSIRLRAAFGAKHIFLDPNPDGEVSYRERKRLFDLPGSSWEDYDRRLISAGGGVFERSAKDIALSPQVRQWLGVRFRSIDGEGLIRLVLTAPVDLLWLGGIGTYVKASSESHEEAGDRANDAVRVDGCQLRAKVVGEGANLGFTQKGRIEFGLAAGMINNDAVDNSGGVDLSDHEVNLKILMAVLERKGIIAGAEERDRWLVELTEEVCRKVIANNRLQSLCLSLDRERCKRDPEPFLEVADRLVNSGLLDRDTESFPARKEVQGRADKGLSRPELAVLMLYSKLALKQTLLENCEFLSEPFLRPLLEAYFPKALRERFAAHLGEHSLAGEITATVLTNTVINQAGCGFLALVEELDVRSLIDAVGAYLNFDAIFEGEALRARLQNLDGGIPAERQYQHLLILEDVLADCCRWALQLGRGPVPKSEAVSSWRVFLEQYLEHLTQGLSATERAAFETAAAGLAQDGFDARAARLLALMGRLREFPLLADLAEGTGVTLLEAARRYEAVAQYLGLARIGPVLDRLTARDHWERRVLILLRGRFQSKLAQLTRALIDSGQEAPEPFFAACDSGQRLERFQRVRRELGGTTQLSIPPFFVLSAELDRLAECCIGAAG